MTRDEVFKKSKRDRVPQGYFEVLPWPQVNGPPVNQLRLEANRFCPKASNVNIMPQRIAHVQPHAQCQMLKRHIAHRPNGNNSTECLKHKMPQMVNSIGASFVGWTNDTAKSTQAKSCLKRIARGFDPQLWVVNCGNVIDFVRADVQPAGLLLVGTSP